MFEELGGFRDVAGSVDDLCLRIRRRFPLARLLHDPDLSVRHRMHHVDRSFTTYRRRCFDEGRATGARARLAGADRELVGGRVFAPGAAPLGVVRNVGDGLRGDLHGFQRAGALVVGVSWALAGYVRTRTGASPS